MDADFYVFVLWTVLLTMSLSAPRRDVNVL